MITLLLPLRTNTATARQRWPILSVRDLQAHFRTNHFGVKRYVKAVDGISFDVQRGEIYGLAGESSSGKTTLIKTIAGAIRPPLEVVGGTVEFAFPAGLWRDCTARRRPKWRGSAGGICPTSCKAR